MRDCITLMRCMLSNKPLYHKICLVEAYLFFPLSVGTLQEMKRLVNFSCSCYLPKKESSIHFSLEMPLLCKLCDDSGWTKMLVNRYSICAMCGYNSDPVSAFVVYLEWRMSGLPSNKRTSSTALDWISGNFWATAQSSPTTSSILWSSVYANLASTENKPITSRRTPSTC